MPPLVLGLLLAVVASLALNGSYLLQHLGGVTAPAVDIRRPLATLRGLLGSRVWVAGTVLGTAGSVVHAGALSQAPLSLVQAFAAAGLAILVPVAARVTRTRLSGPERLGVVAIVTALAALAVHPAAAATVAPPSLVLPLAVAAVAALAGFAGRRQAPVLALATGTLYGVADAATKAFTDLLPHGLLGAVLSPWPVVFLATCAIAFFTFQRALQTGSAITVVALMTGALNLTAVAAGLTIFGEPLGATPALLGLHAAAMAAVGAGAWWLARAQARLADGRAHAAAPSGRTRELAVA